MKVSKVSKKKPNPGLDHPELKRALGLLSSSGMRVTEPRTRLLSLLIAEHGPFGVDEILAHRSSPQMDRVTTYRCLATFEDLGLVRRCEFGDGISRYEYVGGTDHHHHHVICKQCRKTENIDGCVPANLVSMVQAMGYDQVTHSLEFFGICKDCRGHRRRA